MEAKLKSKILIVDDNEELLMALRFSLQKYFDYIKTEKNPNLIPNLINNESFDIILLDMNFTGRTSTGNEGIFWMNKIHEHDPDAIVVFITAYSDVELAVKSIKKGAVDFIEKSWDEKKIVATIINAYKLRQSRLEIKKLKEKQTHLSKKLSENHGFVIGQSKAIQEVMSVIDKVASTEANILILGENGTGKEIIARDIHQKSNRANEIFVSVDIAALSETLFESELFGHVKGAFTDAKTDRAGRFEIASGGTLFLDEIGNLPMALQSKLLSVIQNREITRLGSEKPIQIDIRLICATNKPIYEMVKNGTFREDLLYRINTIKVELPGLRNRVDDIPVFADFFIRKYTDKYDKQIKNPGTKLINFLKDQTWPGNIREFQHAIEKAVILSSDGIIDKKSFEFSSSKLSKKVETSFNIAENEKRLITKALKKFEGNMTKTASELGINRSTLYDKLGRYGL